MPTKRRFNFSATRPVVPEPTNGSRINSLGLEPSLMHGSTSARRERSEMRLGIRPCVDVPDGSDIASVRTAHGGGVVAVLLALAEKENVFVAARGPVFDALRLAIRLVPNDVGAQIPTFLLESEGKQPRHADQIFRLQSLWRGGRMSIARTGFFLSVARQVRPPEV